MGSPLDLVKSLKFQYLSVFLAAIILRGLPELLVPCYPVGYETITWYAPVMMTFYNQSLVCVFQSMFRSGPLFYVLMWFLMATTKAHPFSILKIVAPLLYAGLAISYIHFLRRGLRLEAKIAFAATLLLVFQVATLRESWDRFRNVLALIFLFATLTALKKDSGSKWLFASALAVLAALSRDYIALVLFFTVLASAVLEKRDVVASLAAITPALAVFTLMVYPTQLWSSYVAGGTPAFYSETYLGVLVDTVFIFAVCFFPLLPFVIKGFKKDKLLGPMLAFLLFGSFSAVVTPWFAVPGYQRWLILLIFPFSVYAAIGFERFQLFSKRRMRMLIVIMLSYAIMGTGYATGRLSYVMLPSSWVPSSLVQTSIAWEHVDNVKEVLGWLNENAAINSSVLAEERFYGWTLIYLKRANEDLEVLSYGAGSSPTLALERALSDGYNWVYLIWYTDSDFKNFKIVYSRNNISIFEYVGFVG